MRLAAGLLVAACACSPGYHRAVEALPSTTASPGPLAEEEALRASFPPSPWHVSASADPVSVAPGGSFVVRGTSDCGFLQAALVLKDANGYPDPRPLEARTVDSAFTARGVVPLGTPAQDASVEVSTGCGPAEADAVAAVPLRIGG